MKKSVFEFIGSLAINLVVIVAAVILVKMTQGSFFQYPILVLMIIFFILRFYYDGIKKLYNSVVNCAFISCDTIRAVVLAEKIKKMDFLRIYRRKLFYLECQLYMDFGEKNIAGDFLKKYANSRILRQPGACLSYMMAGLTYEFYYTKDTAKLQGTYKELCSFAQKHGSVVLSDAHQHLADAYHEYAQGNKRACESCLKKIDPKTINNHDKAYYNCVYAFVDGENPALHQKHLENAGGFGEKIPLIEKTVAKMKAVD